VLNVSSISHTCLSTTYTRLANSLRRQVVITDHWQAFWTRSHRPSASSLVLHRRQSLNLPIDKNRMEWGLVIWVAKTLGHSVQSIAHGIVHWNDLWQHGRSVSGLHRAQTTFAFLHLGVRPREELASFFLRIEDKTCLEGDLVADVG
jgi:hypothetical protein